MGGFPIARLRFICLCVVGTVGFGAPVVTPLPTGAFHVEGDALVDSTGMTFVIRGTRLPEFRNPPIAPIREGEFPPFSATIFSDIRLRWNMNAVELPLNLSDYARSPGYLDSAAQVVRQANALELIVVLTLSSSEAPLPFDTLRRFWIDCATRFRNHERVIFNLDGVGADAPALIRCMRDAGATQPVLADFQADPIPFASDVIYRLPGRYGNLPNLTEQQAMLIDGLDPELDQDSPECAAFPADPDDAEALVRDELEYFDSHRISWIVSEYRPGKLIRDYRNLTPTSLEDGWTCGNKDAKYAGIGEAVRTHLWGGAVRGLFAVGVAGSFTAARGSVAILYGGIFASQDALSTPDKPARRLGGVSIRVIGADGVSRNAGLLYASAGWGQANFVVPAECPPGTAEVVLERSDGTSAPAEMIIADVAPGVWTATADGHGPLLVVTGGLAGGGGKQAGRPAWKCSLGGCITLPIGPEDTEVALFTSGFRYTRDPSSIEVRIGDVRLPVVGLKAAAQAGADWLTVRIPHGLSARGEVDLICSVDGRLSNVVRINFGRERLR